MRLIVLYGPPAAGKYTIAKAVAEKTGYKLFHNHLTVDLLKSILTFGTEDFFRLSQQMRLDIFEQAAKENVSGIVFTFVYEKNADDDFIRELMRRITLYGGAVVFIHLYCEKEELLKRVRQESRREFQKLKSEEKLLKALEECDLMSSVDFVKSERVDSTHMTADETISKVLEIIERS